MPDSQMFDRRPAFDEATLFRRAEGFRPGLTGKNQQIADAAAVERFNQWSRYVAAGDRRMMSRRLRQDDLWPSAARHARDAAPPPWAKTLRVVMRTARAQDPAAPRRHDEPFAELLAPAAAAMRALLMRDLRERGLSADHFPAPAAVDGVEAAFVKRLGKIAAPSLLAAFRRQCPFNPLSALLAGAGVTAPDAGYRAFIAETLADGMAAVFMAYPALARSLCLVTENAAAAAAELFARLAADRDALAERFGVRGAVAAAEPGLSDPHAGGRMVARVRFADGKSLAYKPRDLTMEGVFSDLLRWANRQGLTPPQRAPVVLERDGYGWMEWVEPAPCRDGDELDAYWRRAGGLTALYVGLGGVDLHHENLIAAGSHPVLVDVECLMHPPPASLIGAPEPAGPEAPLAPISGFLPMYGFADDGGRAINFGALGPATDARGCDEPAYVRLGGDWIAQVQRPAPFSLGHVPTLNGAPSSPVDHKEAIVAGYIDARRLLADRAGWLLSSPASPLARLRDALGRYMPRPTPSYGLLLTKATSAEAMADGKDFAVVLEALHRNWQALPDGLQALAPLEKAALEALDVPRFSFRPGDQRVHDGDGQPLRLMWKETPFAAAARRLRDAGPADIAYDAALIRAAFSTPAPLFARPSAAEGDGNATASLTEGLRAVADAVAGAAIERPGGAVHWLGPPLDGAAVETMQPSGPGLYGGGPGMALFLAAAARLLADDRLAELAKRALVPVSRLLGGPQANAAAEALGSGYGGGLAGVVAALTWCGRLLDDPALLKAATQAASRTAAALKTRRCHDLLGGDAGLTLALLTLHAETAAGDLLSAATAAGERTLAAAARDGDALLWANAGAPGLAGLSHGGAGFALAFAHLHRATGERRWRDALLGALAFERRVFSPQHDNWPDLRPAAAAGADDKPRFMASWCHGAPGVALGRLGVLAALGDDPGGVGDELAAALRVTQRHALQTTDDLCCGNCGRLDILRAAGRTLGDETLTAAADAGLRNRLDDARTHGRCRLWSDGLLATGGDPHLFKGLAGFGYTLARAAAPGEIPNVLSPGPRFDPAF